MNCLFCKQISDTSRSVEHIIPESLSSKKYILPKCFVCDKCNQYFAVKVEKALLEQPYFLHLRNRSRIENKKRNVPTINIMAVGLRPAEAELSFDQKDGFSISIADNIDANNLFSGPTSRLIIPILDSPKENNLPLSKFLAKLAVEIIIYSVLDNQTLVKEFWNHPGLDGLKRYAMYGQGTSYWPYHQRRIYPEGALFKDDGLEGMPFEILHEFTFLNVYESGIYLVLCVAGIEYAININSPETSTYSNWLNMNSDISPLDNIKGVTL